MGSHSVINSGNMFVSELCATLADRIQVPVSAWVCYGSYAIGQQSRGSDVDLLCIHENENIVPRRVQEQFRGVPVTVYLLSRRDLERDGQESRFGGYFSGKLLNPHFVYCSDERTRRIIDSSSGAFIGSFAASEGRIRRRDPVSSSRQIAADCYLAAYRLCPPYLAYFARWVASDGFKGIWSWMEEHVVHSLELAGKLRRVSGGFIYLKTESEEMVHERCVAAIARFWAFGAWSHGDAGFYDQYVTHADQRNAPIPGSKRAAYAFLAEVAMED
ncbi:MAG: nucleotidyltransferase domain-containing protein [Patescibacteria group bacterium]